MIVNKELGGVEAKVLEGPEDKEARRLRELLREIEDKAFESKPKTFEVFRKFDVDGDGFVSYKDFENYVKSKKVVIS